MLPKISIIICTQNRPSDFADLLKTIKKQTYSPYEIIIVDDSSLDNSKRNIDIIGQLFEAKTIFYTKGDGNLPSSRNIGIKIAKGDIVLFLDDDIILTNDLLHIFATFFNSHPNAVGVQGQIQYPLNNEFNSTKHKFINELSKLLMLTYYKENVLKVRRSGTSIFPYHFSLTKQIEVQRLDGCCMCFRRSLFNELCFDNNLKRWGFMEDLDLSYRAYKKYPGNLFAIPNVSATHKLSQQSRLPSSIRANMITIYWFYIFFKDIFSSSFTNLIAFFFAITNNLLVLTIQNTFKRKSSHRLEVYYLIKAYGFAFKHLRDIIMGDLNFFNKRVLQKT